METNLIAKTKAETANMVIELFKQYFEFLIMALIIVINSLLYFLADLYFPQEEYLEIFLSGTVSSVMVLFYLYIIRNFYKRSFDYLKNQTDMKDTDFSEWFNKQMIFLFGIPNKEISKNNNRIRIRIIMIWVLMGLFVIIWSGIAVFRQGLHENVTFFSVIRFLNTFIFWFCIAFALRVIIGQSCFVQEYSKFNLKPSISAFNNNGYSAIINVMTISMSFFFFFWVVFWLYNKLTFNIAYSIFEIVFVLVAVIIVSFWSIRYPYLCLKLSNQIQKRESIRFDNNIEQTYDKFMKQPNQINMMLLKQQIALGNELKKAMCKQIRIRSIVFILIVNLWVFVVPLLYLNELYHIVNIWR